jgi:phosphatidylglycerophosphatase A
MKNKAALAIATWFGCGYFPVGPGTAGSVAAVLIAAALVQWRGWVPYHFGLLAVVLCIPGVWASGVAAIASGRKDPGLVVVDEVIGQWIAIAGATVLNWKSWLGAFLLFRALDIWKPWPARQLEALPGGTGIVADDVMAGIYAALVLYLAGCLNLY